MLSNAAIQKIGFKHPVNDYITNCLQASVDKLFKESQLGPAPWYPSFVPILFNYLLSCSHSRCHSDTRIKKADYLDVNKRLISNCEQLILINFLLF
jgi:hypothetical protein